MKRLIVLLMIAAIFYAYIHLFLSLFDSSVTPMSIPWLLLVSAISTTSIFITDRIFKEFD